MNRGQLEWTWLGRGPGVSLDKPYTPHFPRMGSQLFPHDASFTVLCLQQIPPRFRLEARPSGLPPPSSDRDPGHSAKVDTLS